MPPAAFSRMDPAHPSCLKALLTQHGIRPRKRLGQHFLCDANVLDRIAEAALPKGHAPSPVVEIGAGLGALTIRLAQRSPRVVAVEIDASLMPALDEVTRPYPNITCLHGDFLKMDTEGLLKEAFGGATGVVAGNIPYGITTPILERLWSCPELMSRFVLLVQYEVAGRLTAKPGTKDYGALTLFAAYHGTVQKGLTVARHLFHPPPEVESMLISWEPAGGLAEVVRDAPLFFRVVRAAFGERRKTLVNALVSAGVAATAAEAREHLEACGIAPDRRGETLSPIEFARLTNQIGSRMGNRQEA